MVRAPRRLSAGSDVPGARAAARSGRRDALALAAWAVLVAVSSVWGALLLSSGARLHMWAPPLAGYFHPRLGAAPVFIAILAVFAVLAVANSVRLAERLEWRRLLLVSFLGAAAWAVLLAAADGPHGLIRSVVAPADVSNDLASVVSPGAFLSSFVDRIGDYAVHTQAHPPGLLLILWVLSRAGLHAPFWEAALEITGGAAAVPAVLVAVREVAGTPAGRRAAPFLVLAPAAMFVATSADALYMGVGAWAVALLVCATGRRSPRAEVLGVAGGVVIATGLFLSYGLVPVLAIPVVVALARRRVLPLLIALAVVGAAMLLFGALGFWWPAGLEATRQQYFLSVARHRPYSYFLLADLAAFALALGPVVAVALGRLRDRRLWLLVGGALVAVGLADLSGLSKGEVERIWLPFVPWVLAACCTLAPSEREGRRWLAIQVAAAFAMQVAVRSPW